VTAAMLAAIRRPSTFFSLQASGDIQRAANLTIVGRLRQNISRLICLLGQPEGAKSTEGSLINALDLHATDMSGPQGAGKAFKLTLRP